MCLFRTTKAEQQASNKAAPPEPEEVERQKPKRGLTSKLTGAEQQDGVWASMKCKPKCRHAV